MQDNTSVQKALIIEHKYVIDMSHFIPYHKVAEHPS